LFLLIAIVGGGFTAKEITIPAVPKWARVIAGILGIFVLAISLYTLVTGSAEPLGPLPYKCRHPHELPSAAEGNQSETEVRKLLQDHGFYSVITDGDYTHPGVPNGIVVGQNPEPGKILCPRDDVHIIVTK
jgi:PASTA domain